MTHLVKRGRRGIIHRRDKPAPTDTIQGVFQGQSSLAINQEIPVRVKGGLGFFQAFFLVTFAVIMFILALNQFGERFLSKPTTVINEIVIPKPALRSQNQSEKPSMLYIPQTSRQYSI